MPTHSNFHDVDKHAIEDKADQRVDNMGGEGFLETVREATETDARIAIQRAAKTKGIE